MNKKKNVYNFVEIYNFSGKEHALLMTEFIMLPRTDPPVIYKFVGIIIHLKKQHVNDSVTF